MGLLNKIKMRTYCKEARESFTNTSTSFYELNSKNVQYSISFSIEHIVLILILNVQYSIFNINNQYSILITPLLTAHCQYQPKVSPLGVITPACIYISNSIREKGRPN